MQVIAITHLYTMPIPMSKDRVFTNHIQCEWVYMCYKYVSGLKIPLACVWYVGEWFYC